MTNCLTCSLRDARSKKILYPFHSPQLIGQKTQNAFKRHTRTFVRGNSINVTAIDPGRRNERIPSDRAKIPGKLRTRRVYKRACRSCTRRNIADALARKSVKVRDRAGVAAAAATIACVHPRRACRTLKLAPYS